MKYCVNTVFDRLKIWLSHIAQTVRDRDFISSTKKGNFVVLHNFAEDMKCLFHSAEKLAKAPPRWWNLELIQICRPWPDQQLCRRHQVSISKGLRARTFDPVFLHSFHCATSYSVIIFTEIRFFICQIYQIPVNLIDNSRILIKIITKVSRLLKFR